jgi:ankyrin repeat protein
VHTLQRDLRTHAHGEAITALAIAVRSSQDGPASLELVDLRFMAETPGPPPEPDEPVQVEVHDDEGEAVGDAVVTFDAERVNWARSQTTDINGSATLTPLHTAARFDRADVIDVLFEHGARLADLGPGQAPLHKAVQVGALKAT